MSKISTVAMFHESMVNLERKEKPILSTGDMYRELIENITDGTYDDLISKLARAGPVLLPGRYDDLTDQDLADAWDAFYNEGSEAAVEYLETGFGFIFYDKWVH